MSELTPDKTLGLDLNLDSLGRVELLSAIELELGVYMDETQVGPEMTLGELETLVRSETRVQQLPFPKWPRALPVRLFRAFAQYAVIFPALRLFYRIQVRGWENLRDLKGPVLFAANHNVVMDNPLIFYALPIRWLWRLSPAAAADDVFGHRFWRWGAPLFGNAFPFSREGSVRASLEHLGQLLDWDWSVLIFPEGYHTRGDIKAFKPGAGLIVTESHTSVVPVRVLLQRGSCWDGTSLFSRGHAEVRFGRPLVFDHGVDHWEATAQLEAAVRAL